MKKKIHRTRELKKTHVTVVITNGNEEILERIKKTLIKMRRLFEISYVVTEVDFTK